MRIGIDANRLLIAQTGGIEVYLAELVARLPRLGSQHEFVLYFNYTRGRHRETVHRFESKGVRVRVCRIPPRLMAPLQRHWGVPADWIVGEVNAMFYPHPVGIVQRRGRAVVTVHDLIPLTHPELCQPHHVRDFEARVRRALARADAIIVVSAYTGALIHEWFGIPADRVHRVSNGVGEAFRPHPHSNDGGMVAARYGISSPYVLFVGTLEPRKNLLRLIEAFARVAGDVARHHTLVIVGKPAWGAAAVSAAVAKLDAHVRVTLIGHVVCDDLPALYAGATALVFPSLAEGFGIPPLEAMACGCPVLTSAIPALLETVGDAALTVDPLNVDAIAEGIHRLIVDDALRATLRARGLCRAKEFSWDRTAADTLVVLEAAA